MQRSDLEAIRTVLTLAENSSLWTMPGVDPDGAWYAAIQKVRLFLRDQGVLTTHEILRQIAAEAVRDCEPATDEGDDIIDAQEAADLQQEQETFYERASGATPERKD